MSDQELQQLRDKDEKLTAITKEIASAKEDVETAKAELKDCKEVLDNLFDQLQRVAGDHVQSQLPFPR